MEFSMEVCVRGDAANPSSLITTAQTAERVGFAQLGLTDHPAPSKKWLTHGGHSTFDPFAGLCFLAGVTRTIRLMTYLAVLPYRNPLLLAKSVATVDRLSGGRFTMVAGTGYLRSEFAALGRSFEDRNQLFEEAIDLIRNVYTADGFAYAGRDFQALDVICDPLPVQLPHPPIWIGGSSRASRRRVASYGAGWSPIRTDEEFAPIVRSSPMSEIGDIAAAINDLRHLLEAEGRNPLEVAIQLDGFGSISDPPEQTIERAAELAEIGVTHLVVRPPSGPTSLVVEALEQFGSEVIAKCTQHPS